MLGNELGHLEHVDSGLSAEDLLEGGIGVDVALLCRILEILALDVDPELLDHLRAGHRALSYDCREVLADVQRLHKC
jgi:hypothetical protein